MCQYLFKEYVLELLEEVQRVVCNTDLLGSPKEFHRSNVDFLKVDDTHTKNFLADVVGFFIDS